MTTPKQTQTDSERDVVDLLKSLIGPATSVAECWRMHVMDVAQDTITRLRQELSALRKANEWIAIDDTENPPPKDGTEILFYGFVDASSANCEIGWYEEDDYTYGWRVWGLNGDEEPRWMKPRFYRLIQPPKDAGQ